MQNSMYHIVLRVSALTLALVLLFESGLLSPITKELSDNTRYYLAQAVGVQVAVAPNEINTITAQLTAKEKELAEREKALASREIGVSLKQSASDIPLSTFVLSVLLFIMLVLIVLNYALDYLRQKPKKTILAT